MTEMHPVLQWVVALGAVATASAAVWRYWLRHVVHGTCEAIEAAVEIAALLREVRDFMKEQVPLILARLDSGAARFDEHERRIVRVERHIGIEAEEREAEGVTR